MEKYALSPASSPKNADFSTFVFIFNILFSRTQNPPGGRRAGFPHRALGCSQKSRRICSKPRYVHHLMQHAMTKYLVLIISSEVGPHDSFWVRTTDSSLTFYSILEKNWKETSQ